MTSAYESLGLKPVINASATLTKLGGSRMPTEVVQAMEEASHAFIDLFEMQERVGKKIAQLTNNEAAFITSGAAAGITLAVASCITGTNPDQVFDFPALTKATKTEVILWKASRNGYDYAVTTTGATIVEIGSTAADFEAAINERTACAVYFPGTLANNALPIEDVVRIAKARGVPVLVDAAAQIPPVENLWHFTRDLGCTGVIFSGGKGIRGPQSSGLVLGTQALIDGMRLNGPPNQSIGRPMKVGKEELAGILAAVQYTLEQDETAILGEYDEIVHGWIEDLAGLPGNYHRAALPQRGRSTVSADDRPRWFRREVASLRCGRRALEWRDKDCGRRYERRTRRICPQSADTDQRRSRRCQP